MRFSQEKSFFIEKNRIFIGENRKTSILHRENRLFSEEKNRNNLIFPGRKPFLGRENLEALPKKIINVLLKTTSIGKIPSEIAESPQSGRAWVACVAVSIPRAKQQWD